MGLLKGDATFPTTVIGKGFGLRPTLPEPIYLPWFTDQTAAALVL
jgi:hypothetical protein